jgi:hypothetical protein
MDIRTGEVFNGDEVESRNEAAGRKVAVPVKTELTGKQLRLKKIGKKDKCPCGSYKKFKDCCYENSRVRRAKARLHLQPNGGKISEMMKAQALEDVESIVKNFPFDKKQD